MKKILWTQNENPSIPSTIINTEGDIIAIDSLKDGGFSLFDELLDYEKSCSDATSINNLVVKRNRIKRKGLKSRNSIETIGYFISSAYNEKDDLGRSMPFMFYIESKDSDEVIKNLNEFSKKINRTIDSSDLKSIEKYIKTKKKTKIIVGSIVIIILIYILWKINS